jgi:protein kinase A
VNKGAPILPPGNQTLEGQAEHQEQVQEHQSTQQFIDSSIIQQRQSRPKLKLDDFHLLRTLGTGSFGRVHLAQSKVNARFYAIKVLKKSEVVRLKQVEHTNNEKHILEAVAHPFLVNMWGTFQDDANLYMVMDYVPGGELFSVLRKSQVKNKRQSRNGMGIHFTTLWLIHFFFLWVSIIAFPRSCCKILCC